MEPKRLFELRSQVAKLVEDRIMKVKVFCTNGNDIENKINEWLEDVTINIHHITQSESDSGKEDAWVVTISIFYTEAD